MLLNRLFEQRGQVMYANPRDPVLAQWLGLSNLTASGIAVTPETAMRLTAVFACVRILSESVATLGVNVYRRLPRGKELARNHPLWKLLHLQPNASQTAFEWLEMVIGHLCLRGNSYNRLIWPQAGALQQIVPLHPDHVRPFRDEKGAIWYEWSPKTGEKQTLSAEEVLHFKVFSTDGLTGKSVIDANAEAVGLSLAAEQFGSTFFRNGVVPSGNYSVPNRLSDKAYERLRAQLAEHTGLGQHRPMILEEGLKWDQLSIRPDQAQFLETRRFQIAEIARMFRVPPHMIAELDRATFNNIEHLSQEFVTFSLMPWLARVEQRLDMQLLTENGKKMFFCRFDVRQMLRGDATARSNLYKTMFYAGAYSPNDIREMEDDNPVEGGDEYYIPINMQPAGTPPPAPAQNGARAFGRLITDCWRKVVTAEVRALSRMLDDADGTVSAALDTVKPLMRRQLGLMADVLADAYERQDAQQFCERAIADHVAFLGAALTERGDAARDWLKAWDAEAAVYIERQVNAALAWAAGSADHANPELPEPVAGGA